MLHKALVFTSCLLAAQAAAVPVFERQANEACTPVTKTVTVTARAEPSATDSLPEDIPGRGGIRIPDTGSSSSSSRSGPTSTKDTTARPTNDIPNQGSGDGYSNGVYFANWGIYNKDKPFLPSMLPGDKINRVLYSFMGINSDGSLNMTDEFADTQKVFDTSSSSSPNDARGCVGQMFEMKKKHRQMKVLLSIGGWTYSLNGQFKAVMSDSGRKNFAKSAVEFVANWGMDGVDIDWEYPSTPEEGSAFTSLLKEVRTALDAYSKKSANGYKFLLTAAVPADPVKIARLDLKGMEPLLDAWNVMSYDYAGSWDKTSGHQANLNPSGDKAVTPFDTEAAIKAYTDAGIKKKNIQLGLPLYGRSFQGTEGPGKPYTDVGPGGIEKGVWLYRDLPLQGAKETWDDKLGASWSYDAGKKELISYDTPEAAKKKADYLMKKGLGGAFFWDAAGDKTGSDSLVGILHSSMGKIEAGQNLLSYPESKFNNIKGGASA